MTVRAIYRNGVFGPQQVVELPENSEVEVTFPAVDKSQHRNGSDEIFEILSHRYNTGQTDAAGVISEPG